MGKEHSVKLANIQLPATGFGTWQLDNGKEAKDATLAALEAGYRLIDTAMIYGNEESVGAAINESGVPREDIFLTTKLWNGDRGYNSAHKAFGESLKRLGLDYIDLYLIHWPGDDAKKRQDSWKALEEIKADGRVRHIGVSNYEPVHLEELLTYAKQPPAVNQVEFHPFIYEKQMPTLESCRAHKIIVEAYSPLARSRQMNNPVLAEIADSTGKSAAQVMLRWAVQHGTVPIPKSSNEHRIKENLDIFDFELDKGQMQAIDSLGSSKSSMPFYTRLLK